MKITPNKLEDAYKMYRANMLLIHIAEVTGLSENIITKYIEKKKRERRLYKRRKKV